MNGNALTVGLVCACLGLSACGSATPEASSSGTVATTSTVASTPTATAAKPAAKPKPKPQPSPGSLPQSTQLPSPDTPQFHDEMAALWAGVTQNSVHAALPAFFPLGAYIQVKAIANPQADYAARLLGDLQLDIAAAHALLGGQPARLVTVRVPQPYAHWVSPGACLNRVGYYEVPNARVVYEVGGAVRSFGIASMISWRGVWYVVHLGAVVRSGAGGVVDDPSSGFGQSSPSSTC